MDEDFIVTMDDLRKCQVCASGARNWFRSRDMDFQEFLSNGILASDLVASEDALAIRAVEMIREKLR